MSLAVLLISFCSEKTYHYACSQEIETTAQLALAPMLPAARSTVRSLPMLSFMEQLVQGLAAVILRPKKLSDVHNYDFASPCLHEVQKIAI